MAAKKKPTKVYTFIDTNIFLDFYRSQNETSLALLRKLEGVKENVICTYQVEMEFLKNRHRAIIDNISDKNLNIDPRLPAVMDDSNLSGSLKKHKSDLDKKKKELKKRVSNIIGNPVLYDPIYKSLEAIFYSKNDHVLTRDMKIRHKVKRLAWRRFILGYPPRKSTDTSIGDALNWEWFIHCAQKYPGKYVIVSRDSDYGTYYNDKAFLNDALKAEFRDRVGKKSITYKTKLSEALKLMEVTVTPAEEKVEQEQMANVDSQNQSSKNKEKKGMNTLENLLRLFDEPGSPNS
ncbi:PIN domain-containing protein [Microbulbifer litoralis]|uniref:PIN domain-containing protein n=1 Tax=Microbulbifer litoralis TaxID=2933965 RepID=UPI00202967AE|nr:PIN domain-containing protein [Microbulbifer sp. GX H0434]